MVASASDKASKVGRSTATTLSSPGYTVGNASINVASTTNYPTDTGVIVSIDEVDSNGVRIAGTYNVFQGVISSATQISSLDYIGGDTERDYPAGATTRVYISVSSFTWNRLIEAFLHEHTNPNGGHGAVTATSLATNTIAEATAASGVTVDGLLIKDSKLATNNSVVTANITNSAVTAAKISAQCVPDYANMTTSKGSSWTADANGFVILTASHDLFSAGSVSGAMTINTKGVIILSSGNNAGGASNTGNGTQLLIPIKTGDVIASSGTGTFNIYYMPAIWV